MPVNFLGALGELSSPVVAGFALFPLVAIFYQFGKKKGIAATIITLLIRQIIVVKTNIFPESIEIFVGMVILIVFAIANDRKHATKKGQEEDEEQNPIFEENTKNYGVTYLY